MTTRPTEKHEITPAEARIKALPALAQLQAMFDCYPDAGILRWKIKPSSKVEIGDQVGTPNMDGYLVVTIAGGKYFLARLLWLMATGADPGLMEVDHINLNPRDNRISNLRLATRSLNEHNKKRPVTNRLGIPGVVRRHSKYLAEIRINGKTTRLGLFDCKHEAGRAYARAKAAALVSRFSSGNSNG